MIGVAGRARRPRHAHSQPVRRRSFEALSPTPEDLAAHRRARHRLAGRRRPLLHVRLDSAARDARVRARRRARAGPRSAQSDRRRPDSRRGPEAGARSAARSSGLEPIPVRHSLTLGEIVAWRAEEEDVPREQRRGFVGVAGLARDGARHRVGSAVRGALAEHAHLRDGARLPRRLPRRGDRTCPRGAGRRARSRSSARRGSTARASPTSSHALGLAGLRRATAHVSADLPEARGARCAAASRSTSPTPPPSDLSRPTSRSSTLARSQAPDRFAFRTEKYEFLDDIPAFDLLTGDSEARERILRGDSARDVAESIAVVDEADRAIFNDATTAARVRKA